MDGIILDKTLHSVRNNIIFNINKEFRYGNKNNKN